MNVKTLYYSLADTHPRFHKTLYPALIFVRSLRDDLVSLPRQLLQIDFVRWLLCFLLLPIRSMTVVRVHTDDRGVAENTIPHNMRGSGEMSSPRSHDLIRPLVSALRNPRDAKVLTIGPRGIGELLNLWGYGFLWRNIRGLDLFSRSRRIDVGNMHSMPYPDASFEVVMASAVLPYSDDKQKAADEMNRVCKPGGYVAVLVAWFDLTEEDVIKQGGLRIGSKEKIRDVEHLERLFRPEPGNVVFRYDGSRERVNGAPIMLVYRKG